MIKLGAIGAGMIAGVNLEAILNFDVEVVAIANRTVSRAQALADKLGIKDALFYADYNEMIAKENLDAVLITLSHDLHLDSFKACANAGVDVIIEKPLAMTFEECEVIQELAEKNNIKACVCHTQRYNPSMATARHLMDTMDFGKVHHIDDTMSIFYYHDERADWMLSKEISGNGPMINYGVHQFDRVYFLKGALPDPKSLYAQLSYCIPEQECISAYTISGSDNDGFTYNFSFSGYSGPVLGGTDVFCENGVIRVMVGDCPRSGVFYSVDNEQFKEAPLLYENSEMYKHQFKEAVACLNGEENKAVDINWSAQMVRMIDICNESEAKETVIKDF
ncbi:MAG: Gfo/Idh/MocA family oxidoreductase [Clostridia bacterium]|jgi:predicted dehydrogenase|nr:Gfo/Idh/MocA family oxidoreductase [Clostridia bacterium]MBT7122225.1 Gfo/Idh/MocA family oxidoreductase [Clostridia bacterium]